MNYWLHRIKHHKEISESLFELGYLTIGFSDLSDERIIKYTLKNQKIEFDKICKENHIKNVRTSNNLWRFLSFEKGDIVIVPQDKTFAICEIIDDIPKLINEFYTQNKIQLKQLKLNLDNKLCIDNKIIDLGFVRKINILKKQINRNSNLDENFKSKMKIRQTNSSLNEFENILKEIINIK